MKLDCSIVGCRRKSHAKGLCNSHYAALRRGDDLTIPRRASPGAPLRWILDHVNYNGDGCLIWPFGLHGKGYASLSGTSATRLMCEAANGPAPSRRHEAAHSCGKGHEACIHPKHLRWATKIENHADQVVHGTRLIGAKNPSAVLNEAAVRRARAMRGQKAIREIASSFGVSFSCMRAVLAGETWKHVS